MVESCSCRGVFFGRDRSKFRSKFSAKLYTSIIKMSNLWTSWDKKSRKRETKKVDFNGFLRKGVFGPVDNFLGVRVSFRDNWKVLRLDPIWGQKEVLNENDKNE